MVCIHVLYDLWIHNGICKTMMSHMDYSISLHGLVCAWTNFRLATMIYSPIFFICCSKLAHHRYIIWYGDLQKFTFSFWYAVTAMNSVSLNTYVRNVEYGNLSISLARTKWKRGWYLCIEFNMVCVEKERRGKNTMD